ncbi:MAG: hypothetical protein ACOC2L_01280, partial [Candidatus Sumerlaeota bacterium]
MKKTMQHLSRNILLALLALTLAIPAAWAQEEKETKSEKEEPVYIVPIGDSITQGGRRDDEYSWRYPLFQILTDKEVDFDFVGAYTKGLQGDFKWPDHNGIAFDADHQAKYGIKTA